MLFNCRSAKSTRVANDLRLSDVPVSRRLTSNLALGCHSPSLEILPSPLVVSSIPPMVCLLLCVVLSMRRRLPESLFPGLETKGLNLENAVIKKKPGQKFKFFFNLKFGITGLAVLPCVFVGRHPIMVQCLLVDDLFPVQPGKGSYIQAVFRNQVAHALHACCSFANREMSYIFPAERSFVRLVNDTLSVYVDGYCLNNDQKNAAAGVGVYFSPNSHFNRSSTYHDALTDRSVRLFHNLISDETLERKITSQRVDIVSAMLAIFLCLELRKGRGYYFKDLRINTDSKCVVDAFHDWVPNKSIHNNNWTGSKGGLVRNQDLFELLWEVTKYVKDTKAVDDPVTVIFCHVCREENSEADTLAKAGAEAARGQWRTPKASSVLPIINPMADSAPETTYTLKVDRPDAAQWKIVCISECLRLVYQVN